MIQMNLFTKKKQSQRLREGTYGYHGGKGGQCRMGVWDWHVHITIFKIKFKKIKIK